MRKSGKKRLLESIDSKLSLILEILRQDINQKNELSQDDIVSNKKQFNAEVVIQSMMAACGLANEKVENNE